MAAKLYETQKLTHRQRGIQVPKHKKPTAKAHEHTQIMAATWENDTARKFQADRTPVETISGKELAERLVACAL